jgi:dipeptidase
MYPFSVKPDKPVTFHDIMKLERDHYEGTKFDTRVGMAASPFGNPHRNSVARQSYPANSGGWERTICINNTNYATIVTARGFLPDWIGGMTWFVYDSPCLSCYIPIYCGATALPKSFDTGMRGGSYDVFSRESAWWAFNFVSNWAELKRSVIEKDILAVRDPIEAEFFAMQPVVEETAATLYEKNPELARQFISTYTFNAANKVAEAYGNLARKLVGRYADGRRYGDDTFVLDTVGYPDWWLKAVEFGQSTIRPEAK